MAGTFKTVNADRIRPKTFCLEGVTDCHAFMNNSDTSCLQSIDIARRITAGGLDEFDLAIDDCMNVTVIIQFMSMG
ncbi:hypothetical protein D3C84_1186280 [compost metagenome]